MANFNDLIGNFLQSAMAPSGQQRIGNALEDLMRTGMASLGGGAQGGQPPGAAAGGMGDLIGQVLGAVQGGLSTAAQNPTQAGGIGAVIGGLLGGGGSSLKGAMGGGALAMLASIAFKAIEGAGQGQAGGGGGAAGVQMPGMRVADTPQAQQAQEDAAQLVLQGMINAAKADGQIDATEMQRIVGKLQETGMDEQTRAWVLEQMASPLDLDAFAAAIPSQQVAAQVYAASLLAIDVDSDTERSSYLSQLAEKTGLHPTVVQQIQQSMGMVS